MKCLDLHPWDLSYNEAIKTQKLLRDKVILQAPSAMPTLVAGADVSYSKGSDTFFSGVVVLRMPIMNVIEEATAEGKVSFPYIPGLLSFRETPVLIKAFEKLRSVPDVIIIDGQGIAHPRGLGIASHIGLILDVPTIGCAKNILVGSHAPVGTDVGSSAPIIFNGKVVGSALRTKRNALPVFVSPGHKMDIPSATEIVMRTCRGYRLPEPTRQAHILVNRVRSSFWG